MSDDTPDFDIKAIEAMNEKAIQNQFFTPDNIYIELGLLKDIPIGAVYMEHIFLKQDEDEFNILQEKLLPIIPEYQKRIYDTVEPFFTAIGYNDATVDALIEQEEYHDHIFLAAPATQFIDTLIRHIARNQNHSRPANKYNKKTVGKGLYVLEPQDVTYWINTYPLTLSAPLLESLGRELGESFGVNIAFLNKNPSEFDAGDWDEWMEKIDCFYFDSLGRFTRSPFVIKKQGDMQFVGCYFFARKRFERCVIEVMRGEDFNHQIQVVTAQLGLFCDFEWLQNNDARLTEEAEDVPMNEDQAEPDTTPDSGTES